MNLTKCKNGHFYDTSMYQTCPHCQMAGDNKTIMVEGDFISPDMLPETNVPHPPIPPITPVPVPPMPQVGARAPYKPVQPAAQPYSKPQPAAPAKADVKFPVGFAVCISGENRGDSYKLKEYDNFLGRKSENDICLDKDISVSRIKHANIYYLPETREFWLMRGQSKETIRLRSANVSGYNVNDPGVMVNDKCRLNAYDEIIIGKSVIKLVPLCGPGFSWQNR